MAKNPNLKQWEKGQSGNPSGKKTGFKKALIAELAKVDARDGRTNAEIIAEKWVWHAKQGSIRAIAEIRDTVEGRPSQAIDLNANINRSPEEQVESILESLAILEATNEPGDHRVN